MVKVRNFLCSSGQRILLLLIGDYFVGDLKPWRAFYVPKLVFEHHIQGHPLDLFLIKISALQANFCWLGDLKKICPWKESDPGKQAMQGG